MTDSPLTKRANASQRHEARHFISYATICRAISFFRRA
ncbi:hypothetical protein roselon_02039 [Roseibacterium elongatum DSM 19469]|uniref:Uncharacterized protein n=1 Tax=Roseicyclus elongatus DSM 19469 TaxID=1294273 RepID=W8SPD4_9RHOB|nr:hypothetical protein roselon_02039 [Roseibacterium elongatum DSM 19469]